MMETTIPKEHQALGRRVSACRGREAEMIELTHQLGQRIRSEEMG